MLAFQIVYEKTNQMIDSQEAFS